MQNRPRNIRVPGVVACIALVALLTAACTTGGRTALAPPGPDETPVWMLGDSLAWATAANMRPLPYVAAAGGAGFTPFALSMIIDHAIDALETFDDPTHVLVMGGVNDSKPTTTTQDIIDGMMDLEAELSSRGIVTIWIAEPGWAFAPRLDPLADWINTQPNSIDCRSSAGGSSDRIHPTNFTPMAVCIDEALVDMGVIWSND